MAIRKATTTKTITDEPEAPAEPGAPTAPDVLANVDEEKLVTMKAPTGYTTKVPQALVESLLASGYTKGR